MRYTVTKQRLEVLGDIWQPGFGPCGAKRDLTAQELQDIGDVHSRAAVERWARRNFGDFSHIIDIHADFHVGGSHVVHNWSSTSNARTFARTDS